MRDRLIELLKGAETKVTEMNSTPLALEEWLGIYADYLLENGVIVPPCKVGDTVFYLNKRPHIALRQNTIYEAKVVRIFTAAIGTALNLVIQIHNDYGCVEIPDIKKNR